MPALLVVAGVLAGVAINMLADSLPHARRIDAPQCPACSAPRGASAWSGLVSLLAQRRRCPQCEAPLPVRHLVVELVTPILFVVCWLQTGSTLVTLFRSLYVAILVLISVTDIEHRLILHAVSLPAIVVAVAGAYLPPAFDSPKRALLGGAIGLLASLILFLVGQSMGAVVGRMRGEPLSGPAFVTTMS